MQHHKNVMVASMSVLILAGCSSAATLYVPPGDPVLGVCQSADVQNIGNLQVAVDNANNTNPSVANDQRGQMMTDAQVTSLNHAAASYRTYAAQVETHHAFADALRNEAQEFATAASSPTRLTTNTVAVAADRFSGEIQRYCGSFQVGAAPKPAKPGPGLWDWELFGFATAGYLLMTLLASYVIAVGQRSRPRKKRLGPAGIFWRSLIWWVSIFTALGSAWSQWIAMVTLTPDERKDDRIAAQQKEIARLEKQQLKDTLE